jgi:uncharacterized protein
MKAIVQADIGGSQVMRIGEVETPSPNENEVLVKVKELSMMEFFDPFRDRMARDIRNSLTSAFISEITGKHPGAVCEIAKFWLSRTLKHSHLNYIEEMKARYAQTLEMIHGTGCEDIRLQAVLLWNSGLFFEMHELLEMLFTKTTGLERVALKGMIQAAGVYVHANRGNQTAAQGLALRARNHLMAGVKHLRFITNLDQLIENLKDPTQAPIMLDTQSG